MQAVYLRELTPEDAKALARLGSKLYPRGFREDWQSIRHDLEQADAEACNLSLGVFDGRRLVGYLLAYALQTTDLKELPYVEYIRDAEVIYVNDLAVERPYRHRVHELLDRFGGLCRRHFPQHVVVAHGLNMRMYHWINRHEKTFTRKGYRLTNLQGNPLSGKGQDLYLAQWRPVPESEPGAFEVTGHGATISRVYAIAGHSCTVELIRDEDAWQALEPIWDELLRRTPEHTVFQSFDYLRIWWRHFGLSRRLYILVIRREQEIVGIAPLQLSPVKVLGRYFWQLGFIGTRWEVDRPKLLFPTGRRECCQAMLRFLVEHRDAWDLCEFYEQASDDALMKQLQTDLNKHGYLLGVTKDSVCPFVRFDGSWPEFLTAKSRKLRKNLKAARRKLEELGSFAYVSYRQGDMGTQLERYAALEARSWKVEQKVGCHRSAQYFGFYKDLATSFGRRNSFHFRFLTLDDEPIAGTFGLQHDGRYYSLQIVHDPVYGKYSPGTLLEAMELEECFDSGLVEYDFLGGFLNNKSRWTDLLRQTAQLHVFKTTPRLRLIHFTYFAIKPRVKQFLRRWGLMSPLAQVQSRLRAQQQRWLAPRGWATHEESSSHGS